MKQAKVGELLSSRWTHPCIDGDTPRDRVGYGDISGWSRGTTKAVRPEVGPLSRSHAKPVNLAKVASFYRVRDEMAEKAHNPASVIKPGKDGYDPQEAMVRKHTAIIKASSLFADLYKKGVVKKARVPKEKPKPGILDDVPATDPAYIAHLKASNYQIPRE